MPTLSWTKDDEARKQAQNVPYRLLEYVPELSAGDLTTENCLIQGDNLDTLKALLPFYAGKVKCIYIDPPYNTGSAFEHYDDNLQHSQWLCLMYPRLQLLHELLSEDGSIWVSIDDNEAHYLKVMMDEIFGRKNFIQNIVWQKKFSPQNDAKYISDQHDHIMCFSKNKIEFKVNKIFHENKLNRAKNLDNDSRGFWNSVDYTCNKNKKERPNLYYPIIQPNTGEKIYPKETAVWRYSEETHNRNVLENLVYWGKNGTNAVPRFKKFEAAELTGDVPVSLWLHQDVGNTQDARKESLQFDNNAPFSTPKPERLIQRILQIATNENDLVLDSFLGSGTTAAVAHKMNRRYIGIEMGEHAETHCQPRLKKVIDGEQGGISKAVNWNGGGGFRYYRLGETITNENGTINPRIRHKDLAAHIWYKETKTPLLIKPETALIGIHNEIAYYLLYNGILGDKKNNALTENVLKELPKFHGKKIIYSEICHLGKETLVMEKIEFRDIPYSIKSA